MKLKVSQLLVLPLLILSLIALNRYHSAGPKPEELAWPPPLSAVVEKAPTVDFCELVGNPQQYNNKVVRTEAVFSTNKENVVLYSLECDHPHKNVWVEFDASYVYTDESVLKKLEQVLCPRTQCSVSQALVRVVGRFEGPREHGYGHLDGYRFKFSIMRLEQAEALTTVEAKSR
jgi:hypothetical protein